MRQTVMPVIYGVTTIAFSITSPVLNHVQLESATVQDDLV